MRILIAGAWRYPIFEEACADALGRQGHSVVAFRWARFFSGRFGYLEQMVPLPGPSLVELNREFARTAIAADPDAVLVWRGTHVLPWTLKQIKSKSNALIVTYNNDDPFPQKNFGSLQRSGLRWSKLRQSAQWVWYNRSHRVADIALVYRDVNVPEVKAAGARQAAVLLPYFIPSKDRPIRLDRTDVEKYACDAVFIGHYEPDGRESYLQALVDAGLRVRIFGNKYWHQKVIGLQSGLDGIVEVHGDDYVKAICGSKLGLCFMSKLNRDTYTRRCFEITACGTLLLSERTDSLKKMFREDEEAVFFATVAELVEKAVWLCDHPSEISRIAAAGMRRVHAGRHSVDERMKELVDTISAARPMAKPP